MDGVTLDQMGTMAPMLASPCDVPLESLAGTHVFDTKLDGIRALAYWDGRRLRLVARSGRIITPSFPDLVEGVPPWEGSLILDGEIVATSGSFQDVAHRERLTRPLDVHVARKNTPVQFMAFDVLWQDADVRREAYRERLRRLQRLPMDAAWGPWGRTTVSTNPKAFEAIVAMGGEGVVAKRLSAPYRGGRSRDWLKKKATYSVSCVAVGFEPGSGSRAEIGAVLLAMTSPAAPVMVGKVGSGFTFSEVMRLKRELEAAQAGQRDLPVIEVKAMGLTKDGKLRQPVYLGERNDLTVLDASVDQLLGLPRG